MATAVEQYLAERDAKIADYKSKLAQYKNGSQPAQAETAGTVEAAPAQAAAPAPVPVKDQFNAYGEQNRANINRVYDAGLETQKQSLMNAYNANVEAQQGAAGTIRQTGDTLAHDLAVQNARNMGNINQFADARGVNRQQGSQAQLSLGNARNASVGGFAFRQQAALAENQRQQDLAKIQYQAQVQEALADNDYKKAAALLDDYNNENAWRDQQAQILASYGNFDPYRDLYGEDAATAMQSVWAAQNPQIAYRTGAITANQYRLITGHYPLGYSGGGGGGNDWYDPRGGGPADDGLPGPGSGGTGGGGPVLTPTAINAAERYIG